MGELRTVAWLQDRLQLAAVPAAAHTWKNQLPPACKSPLLPAAVTCAVLMGVAAGVVVLMALPTVVVVVVAVTVLPWRRRRLQPALARVPRLLVVARRRLLLLLLLCRPLPPLLPRWQRWRGLLKGTCARALA